MFDYVGGRYSGGIISEQYINGSFERSDFSRQWVFERVTPGVYETCQTTPR